MYVLIIIEKNKPMYLNIDIFLISEYIK